ncbi:hypothetical protein AB4Z39_31660 [Mycobacterium adipatum]|uniref:hypothetical protein n=1 Tax=Mycobacterium adipatum TaxID=1682113 RepID=UPI0034E05A0D
MTDSHSVSQGEQQLNALQNSLNGPDIDEFATDVGGRHRTVTRVRWRGWAVHIQEAAVVVPQQASAGKTITDLATCLRAAYALVYVGDRTSGPTTGLRGIPRDADLAAAVADVITTAADLATRHAFQRHGCDAHSCLRKAWEDTDMRAPYAAVLATVRAALPGSTTLADFSDAAEDASAVVGLLRRAAALVTQPAGNRATSQFSEARSA